MDRIANDLSISSRHSMRDSRAIVHRVYSEEVMIEDMLTARAAHDRIPEEARRQRA